MTYDPDNHTLRLLQDMRRDNERVAQNVMRCMEIVIKSHERFAALSEELAAFRAETRKQLTEIQGTLLHLENQNMSRHGETIGLLHDVHDLQARIGVEEAS